MELRPWNHVPIGALADPLEPIPQAFLRIEPHPYLSLGAPYGVGACPFRLRHGVIGRLQEAQHRLQREHPEWALAIFDAWRPLAVQRFMVCHTITSICRERGVDPGVDSVARQEVEAEVGRFWAPPNPDPAAPPPHSTGAAVDLTLAIRKEPLADPTHIPDHPEDGACFDLLDMGSAIDAIGPVSEPDHYLQQASLQPDGEERLRATTWHRRRQVLRSVMEEAGFVQHPNEWWHFSWGDQLWAWRRGELQALYGRVDAGEV